MASWDTFNADIIELLMKYNQVNKDMLIQEITITCKPNDMPIIALKTTPDPKAKMNVQTTKWNELYK